MTPRSDKETDNKGGNTSDGDMVVYFVVFAIIMFIVKEALKGVIHGIMGQ